ncbi:hypothetical protein D3C72_1880610 [compost metagenome]
MRRTHGRTGLGEFEKIADQVVDPADFADNVFQVTLVGLWQIGAPMQQLCRGLDDPQRVTDFMGQAHGDFAQGKQAVAATQLRFQMLQLAKALAHVVEGAAQFRQFVAAGHGQALAIVPGNHGLHALGEPAQGFGQPLRNHPADRQ